MRINLLFGVTVDKAIDAYNQTLQAGVVGILAAMVLLALALCGIVFFVIKLYRDLQDDRNRDRQAQQTFNQGLTTQLGQMTASLASVPDVLSLIRSSLEAKTTHIETEIESIPTSTAAKIIAAQQPTFDKALGDHRAIKDGIDDTKNRIQAVADAQTNLQTTLLSKIDALPESLKAAIQNDIALLASKINGIDEALISAKTTLALIYGKVTETPVQQVPTLPTPPKTETSLPTLAAETGATP